MTESGYYPPGAEFDPNAPYNQLELPEEEFDITVTQTLSKTLTVATDNYRYIEEADEDGRYVEYDTDETDWEDVYAEDHHTPEQLIALFKRFLERKDEEEIPDSIRQHLIKECEDWIVEEQSIERT